MRPDISEYFLAGLKDGGALIVESESNLTQTEQFY